MPREWSVQRPWDGRATGVGAAVPPEVRSNNGAADQQRAPQERRYTHRSAPSPLSRADSQNRDPRSQQHAAVPGPAPPSPLPPSSCTRSRTRQTAASTADTSTCGAAQRGGASVQQTAVRQDPMAAAEGGGPGGSCTSGSVAASAVEPEVQELLRAAVRRLRGLRLCENGHEEARLTHLVLGAPRRTLKVRSRARSDTRRALSSAISAGLAKLARHNFVGGLRLPCPNQFAPCAAIWAACGAHHRNTSGQDGPAV